VNDNKELENEVSIDGVPIIEDESKKFNFILDNGVVFSIDDDNMYINELIVDEMEITEEMKECRDFYLEQK